MSSNDRSRRSPVAERRYSAAQAGAAARGGATKPRPGKAKSAKTTRRGKRRGSGRGRGRGGPIGLLAAFVSWIIGILWSVGWRIGALVALVIGGLVLIDYGKLPPPSDIIDGRTRGSVTLLDRDGKVFAWRGDQFGGAITADTVSPNLKAAIVATEDRRFYQHLGVDPRGILGAIRINLSEGRGALDGHGGSTLTQQTAKLLCAGSPYDPTSGLTQAEYEAQCREGSVTRKIREAIYALAMEARYTKDEILTIYMNRVYLGEGTNGFEAASQRYFGRSAAEVDPAEAAMLAGLLVAPTRYAPTNDLERSQDRASVIIGLMQEQGYLTAAQADEARTHPAELSDAAQARAGGYFADWLMSSAPSWLGSGTTEDVVMRTTFDARLQADAEAGLKQVFETKVSPDSKAQAAIVVMSADGAVRAMVGGRKTKVSGAFNRATQAMRQTGSAFKPFIYATALDLGYTYQATVIDEPLTLNVPGSGNWSPQNYTRNYSGRVTLLQAFQESLNIPAVKVQEAVGRDNVRRVAEDFGIGSDLAAGPAMALGTSEATLLETTGAYAGILNGGSAVIPYGLTRVTLMGDNDPIIEKQGGIGERVISQEAAQQLVYMMYNVIEHGTGGRAKLPGRPAAGKTGTTQSARDAWFIGFTGDYVTGVWLGNDDNTPLKGVTGGGLPAEIWREVMARVSEGTPVTPLPMIQPSAPPVMAEIDGGQRRDTASPSTRQGRSEQRGDDPRNVAERVLHDVLGNIFGRRN